MESDRRMTRRIQGVLNKGKFRNMGPQGREEVMMAGLKKDSDKKISCIQ